VCGALASRTSRASFSRRSAQARSIGSVAVSFDVPGESRLRLNFESLFQKYEGYIKDHTQSLLAKLNAGTGDIKVEIINLFAAKMLNFVRNPFSSVKVLNSFPDLVSYDPTDPALLADYRRVVSGRKPQQAHLCAELGISRRSMSNGCACCSCCWCQWPRGIRISSKI
jgi:hypothetical protein